MFIDKLVSWEAASSRLEQAKVLIAKMEKEDERKRREEEEILTNTQATPEIYPDSDADGDAE